MSESWNEKNGGVESVLGAERRDIGKNKRCCNENIQFRSNITNADQKDSLTRKNTTLSTQLVENFNHSEIISQTFTTANKTCETLSITDCSNFVSNKVYRTEETSSVKISDYYNGENISKRKHDTETISQFEWKKRRTVSNDNISQNPSSSEKNDGDYLECNGNSQEESFHDSEVVPNSNFSYAVEEISLENADKLNSDSCSDKKNSPLFSHSSTWNGWRLPSVDIEKFFDFQEQR